MKNGQFNKEWNCYRSSIRTNNSLETKNGLITAKFGAQPFLFEFVWNLREWFEDGFIKYDQYKKQGIGNKKHENKILKDKMLNIWCHYVDQHKTDEDTWLFLKKTRKALKSD